MVSYAVEFHERTAGRIVIPNRSTEFAPEYVVLTVVEPFVYHFESGPIHASKEFHSMIGPVLPLSHPEIEPFRPFKFWAYAVPKVVECIADSAAESGVSVQNHFPFQARCPGMDPEVSIVFQGFVSLVQEGIQVTYAR